MEEMELVCLQIISNAGEARSESMEAMRAAREGQFDEAEAHMKSAGERMREAHDVHTKLITMDAGGSLGGMSLILVHSEDIMMGAEVTANMAQELVEVYRQLKAK